MAKIIPASATEVRTYFVENPKKVPAGDKTVGKGPKEHRGLLSADARKVFETETGKTYVPGTKTNLIEITYTYTQPSGRKATKTESLEPSEVRALAGDKAKPMGRLTKDALEAAAIAKGEQVTKASAEAKAAKAKAAKPAKAKEPKAAKVEAPTVKAVEPVEDAQEPVAS